MNFINTTLEYLNQLTVLELFFLFLFENGTLILVSVTVGFMVDKTIKGIVGKISKKEMLWTFSTLVLNTVITLFGFLLYKYNFIVFYFGTNGFQIILDTLLLIAGMDFLMYAFHYFIHNTKFIKKIHDLHHIYEAPTAITLYVLHPMEVLGFGLLWISLITLYKASIIAVFMYLFLNIVMGIIGHLELEVIPKSWSKNFLTKWIANTTFHNDHHRNPKYNYGFYTSFWDILFGTKKT